MVELRVRTDLTRNSLVIREEPGDRLIAEPARFTVLASVAAPPAEAYLAIDLPPGYYLAEDDLGERDARPDSEVGWQVEVAPEREALRGAIAIRLVSHKVVVASTQVQITRIIEGAGSFDPERDALPFAAHAHIFGTLRPSREVFDATFRRGLRTPLRWLLYRGPYRGLFASGISSGMARAALALAANGHAGEPSAARRLQDRDTRELVQIMHGRQLGDGAIREWRRWISRASPAAVFQAIRDDLLSGRPQRLAIDIGIPRVPPWGVISALARPWTTVVPFHYRIAPGGAVVVDVYDPEHPDDAVNSLLHIDLATDQYEYRGWSNEGADGPTVLAATSLAPFVKPTSAVQAGLALALGLV